MPVTRSLPVTGISRLRNIGATLIMLVALGGCGDETPAKRPKEVKLGTPETTVPSHKSSTERNESTSADVASRVIRPPIDSWPIPFGTARRRETAQYAERHYGRATDQLAPKLVVEHYSVTSTAKAVFNTFARDVPDVELHELPGVCSHFVIDRDGRIFQLVPLSLICRHTVGLNDVAIGIEHVGNSDPEVMDNPNQLEASLRLSAWLRCRYGITIGNVIGHAESLSSPYHHEKVPSLQRQTHSDFQPDTMMSYREQLRGLRC